MDSEVIIIEDDSISGDVDSQNEIVFFTQYSAKKTNSEVTVKTEIKSETPSADVYSQNERECFTEHLVKQIKTEPIIYSYNCEMDTRTEIEKQNPVSDIVSQKNRKHRNKEPCDNVRAGLISPLGSLRLCTEAIPGHSNAKLPLPSAEVSRKNTSFYNNAAVGQSPSCTGADCPSLRTCSDIPPTSRDLRWTQRSSKRRNRTIFTEFELRELESAFHKMHYPDIALREKLTLRLNIPKEKIKVWFQNRRSKWRRLKSAASSSLQRRD